jgi:hypothetical protein
MKVLRRLNCSARAKGWPQATLVRSHIAGRARIPGPRAVARAQPPAPRAWAISWWISWG